MADTRSLSESKEQKIQMSATREKLKLLLGDVQNILSEHRYYINNPNATPYLNHPTLDDLGLINAVGHSKLLLLNQKISEVEKKILIALLSSEYCYILQEKDVLKRYLLHEACTVDFLKKKPEEFSYGSLLKIIQQKTMLGVILATHQNKKEQKKEKDTSSVKLCKERIKSHFDKYKKPIKTLSIQTKTEGNSSINLNDDALDSPKIYHRVQK